MAAHVPPTVAAFSNPAMGPMPACVVVELCLWMCRERLRAVCVGHAPIYQKNPPKSNHPKYIYILIHILTHI